MALTPPPIGEDFRPTIRSAIPGLLEWGQHLFRRTDELLRIKWRPKPAEVVSILFGNRTFNCLRALDLLETDSTVDDQVAILARSLVEMALDGTYVRHDTVRVVSKNVSHPLSIKDKVDLFYDYKVIKSNMINYRFPLEDRARLIKAETFRKTKGIKNDLSWQGIGPQRVLRELEASRIEPEQFAWVELAVDHFQNFSFVSHTNPTEQFYFEEVIPRRLLQLRPGLRCLAGDQRGVLVLES